MEQYIYDNYVAILRSELVPALGCTEPIAIAYAAGKARQALGTQPEEENLYIRVESFSGSDHSLAEIRTKHTHITRIEKNGEVLFSQDDAAQAESKGDRSLLNIRSILEFADCVKIEDVSEVLDRQIQMNQAISQEVLTHNYGANVGKSLLKTYGDTLVNQAKAAAAAGSDARMGGCTPPVVINSGSGNQGMTVSLPVITFAKHKGISKEQLYRCLVVSNLTAIHQKKYIGSLSAYCGAVSAACGSGAAITYMAGGDLEAVSRTITNTIANVGGIVCDGAKASCAAKIASSVDAAITAHYMAMDGQAFQPGEGMVKEHIEDTIAGIGRMGRVGMRSTDVEILNIPADPGSYF